jgi:hypothetical protein
MANVNFTFAIFILEFRHSIKNSKFFLRVYPCKWSKIIRYIINVRICLESVYPAADEFHPMMGEEQLHQ